MTRLILLMFIGWMSTFSLNGQIIVNFDSAENAPAGSQVTIDVAVDDFENIVLFQFGVLWDPTVATFNSVTNVTNVLPQYTSADNIGTPTSAPMEIQEGTIFTSWSLVSADAESLPDGTVLFSIVLDIIGDECEETSIEAGDLPPDRFIEVYDETFSTNLGVVSNGGTISIDGPDCGGGGGGDEDVGLIGEDLCVQPGDVFCMDVEVINFEDIGTAQSGIVWDSTVLMYTGVQDFGLPGLSANLFNTNNVSSGELKFLWFDGTGSTPQTLPDSSVIFSVCFEVIGDLGESTAISFVDLPNPPPLLIEFSNGAGTTLPYYVEDGSIIVSESCSPLSISGGNISNICPDSKVCVPFSVNNFEDVGSVQYTMVWDTTFMSYCGAENLNTVLPVTEFNLNPISPGTGFQANKIRFSWNASAVCDESDGAVLYEVCFLTNANLNDGESTSIDIVNDAPVNIEFGDCDGNAIPNNTVNLGSGSVSINCGGTPDCEVTFDVDDACFGETGGVTATVTGCSNPSLQWQDAAGNNCCGTSNVIFGQQPGDYSLCVTPEGGTQTCHDVTINENPQINISVNETDAFCGNDGSVQINITGGAGGTIPYTISPFIEDENSVPTGTYTITATDGANCSASTTFSIIETDPPAIDISVDVLQPCETGESGIVNVTVTGGCGDASCMIDGQPCMANMSLPEGSYTVTVIDNGETTTEDFEVEATPVVISGTVGDATTGSDGFISINVVPTACNDFSWTGPNGFTSTNQNINGLAAGDYTVIVSCENDCQGMMSFTVNGDPMTNCFIQNLITEDVNCFGLEGIACDGTISGTASAACPADAVFSVNGAPGTATLDLTGLCAGDYVIELITSEGIQDTENITISEPMQLQVAVDTMCTESGFANGVIDLNITGGTAPYTVTWNQTGLVGTNPTNVPAGIYTAIIEDANQCSILAQGIRITDCGGPPVGCFTGSNILTPNGDGANDFFQIQCANTVNNTLEVYDRWGREVFGATNYVNSWGGTETGGDILREGAYMWVLEVDFGLGDIRVYKGTLTVLRD